MSEIPPPPPRPESPALTLSNLIESLKSGNSGCCMLDCGSILVLQASNVKAEVERANYTEGCKFNSSTAIICTASKLMAFLYDAVSLS